MLDQRLRRWAIIKQTLGERVFGENGFVVNGIVLL